MAEDTQAASILVIGGGAIGKFLAAALSCAEGSDAGVVVKAGPNAGELKRDGVTLKMQDRTIEASPPVITDYSQIDPAAPRVVVVTVKAYDLSRCLDELASAGVNVKAVLTPLNGLGIEDEAARVFPAAELIAGSITYPVDQESSTISRITNARGGIVLAPYRGEAGPFQALLMERFRAGGFETLACARWLDMKWTKLLLNITANATSAILDMTAFELFCDETASRIERRMLREYFRVAGRLGVRFIDLPGYPAAKLRLLKALVSSLVPLPLFMTALRKTAGASRGEKLASFHNDLKILGQTVTEAEYLNGAIARAARAAGLTAPFNEALTRILAEVARDYAANPFRKAPSALWEAISA